MPSKKGSTPNAFYFFMLELKNQKGRSFNNIREVADFAAPLWRNLTKQQKEPYEEMARREKSGRSKLTCDGVEVSKIQSQERAEDQRVKEMKKNIDQGLYIICKEGRIKRERFFIIDINTFCFCSSENRHYPAEIAVSCFSLEEGILPENVFHEIISPGSLPVGYTGAALANSKASHQLPLPEGSENNITEVYFALKEFLSNRTENTRHQGFPCLYADESVMKVVQQILDTWHYDHAEEVPLFKVYSLQYLFFVLRNTVAGTVVWPTDTFSAKEIQSDSFTFATNAPCEFHQVADTFAHCCRSKVIRLCYIICNHCCTDLDIPLIKGIHIPDTSVLPSSKESLASSQVSLLTDASLHHRSARLHSDTGSVISNSDWDNRSVVSDSTDGYATAVSNSRPRQFTDSTSMSQYSSTTASARPSSSNRNSPTRRGWGASVNSLSEKLQATGFHSNPNDFPALGSKGK